MPKICPYLLKDLRGSPTFPRSGTYRKSSIKDSEEQFLLDCTREDSYLAAQSLRLQEVSNAQGIETRSSCSNSFVVRVCGSYRVCSVADHGQPQACPLIW